MPKKQLHRAASALRASVALAAALSASGCTSAIKGRADPPSHLASSSIKSAYILDIQSAVAEAKRAEAAYCLVLPSACDPETVAKMGFTPAGSGSLADAQRFRNDFVYAMIRAHRLAMEDYARSLSIEGGSTSLYASLLKLGLTTAATISKVQETARVLNALAVAAIGIDEQYNEQLLLGQTVAALINKMRAAQSREITALLARMNDPVGAYPLAAARADVVRLGAAATIETAVADLTSEAERDRRAAEAKEECAQAEVAKIAGGVTSDVLEKCKAKTANGEGSNS